MELLTKYDNDDETDTSWPAVGEKDEASNLFFGACFYVLYSTEDDDDDFETVQL